MIPAFLDAFKAEIEQYKLEYIKIQAKLLSRGEVLPLTQSKFLGLPFLPLEMEYPEDLNGEPMIMLAQINFSEAPPIAGYPTSGILQWYVSGTDWFDMEDYRILFHKNTDVDHHTDFHFLTGNLYRSSPITREHKLTFSKKTEYGGTTDCRFNLNFDGKDYYDYQKTLTEPQQKELDDLFYNMGHKIGGYAYFTQEDPRGDEPGKENDLLVLQIDSGDRIMFGDSGVANIFLNAEDLKKEDFSKAYFNWDSW